MNRYYLSVGTAVLAVLVGAVGTATAKTKHLTCDVSGAAATAVETNIDTNADGISAGLSQTIINCKGLRFFAQNEAEYLASVPATANCPGATLEFSLVQSHAVRTEEKTGDQLFTDFNAGTLCLKVPDFTFSFTGAGTFEGGTGRFSEATGTFQVQLSGSYLVTGRKEGIFGALSQFTGTSTETLTLP